MNLQFEKWHGIGNDFIVVAQTDLPERNGGDGYELTSALVTAMCDRHFGVGADGVLVVGPSEVADIRMRIHNADGSMAEMCGNGIRVVARYALQHALATPGDDGSFTIETAGGIMRPRVEPDGSVRVDMGVLTTEGLVTIDVNGTSITGRIVDAGNPHYVLRRPIDGVELHQLGPQVETHERFPQRTNVEFYEVPDVPSPTIAAATPLSHVRMRVWERGVGETLACGTGACAVAVTAARDDQLRSPITVSLPGGDLTVDIDDEGRACMTGAAHCAFHGTLNTDELPAGLPDIDTTSTTTHRAGAVVPA